MKSVDLKYMRTGITYECWMDEQGKFHERWNEHIPLHREGILDHPKYKITHIDKVNRIVTFESYDGGTDL